MVKSSAMKILNVKNGYDLLFAFNRPTSTKLECLGHARHYISVVQETETFVPSFDEQLNIASVFRTLDDLITLHQRKLGKLKNIKKSLLEKMFV